MTGTLSPAALEASPSFAHRPKPARDRRSRRRRGWVLLAVAGVLGSLVAAGVGRSDVVKTGGGQLVGEFFAAALRPAHDPDFLVLIGIAAITTLSFAVLGTALSLVIGLVAGVLSSEVWWTCRPGRRGIARAGWVCSRVIMVVPRGIHEVVWGLFFLAVFGLDPIVAVLAIGIPFGAVTAKVFSELLDEAPREPFRALIAAGASRPSALLYGLLPTAWPDLLSYGFYRFECAIRSAAILGLIGAGGLGFQLALSFQSLRYEEIWTVLYALILLSAAADFWSSQVRRRRERSRPRARRDPVFTTSLVVAGALVPLSVWWVGLDPSVLWSGRTWQIAGDLLGQAWPPSLGDGGMIELLAQSGVTVAMSVLAIAVAFCGGAVLAFPAANISSLGRRRSSTWWSRGLRRTLVVSCRALLIVLRAIPPPVWALLFLFVLFPGILPGAMALGVYTMGVLGRLMAEAAENLDGRPLRALRSHGASEMQVFCYGVIPSATPRFVAYGLYRWEVTIRETIVVGVVGAGGLGLLLHQQLAVLDYGATITTLATVITLTLAVDLTSAAIRRSLR